MIQDLNSFQNYQDVIQENMGALIYFSHEKCNVCKVLKPKIEKMLTDHFPEIKIFYADTVKYPEIAAQNSIFTVPTIVIYLDHKEFIRVSRNVSVIDLIDRIKRPYELMFS